MASSQDVPPIGSSRSEALVLTVILLVLMVTVLRTAAALLLPIAISLLLMFLLGPVVRWLHGRGIREGIAAALVVFGTVGALGTGVALLAGPAATWLSEAPATVAKVESRLRKVRRSISGFEKTAEQIQRVADAPTGAKTTTVEVRAPGALTLLGGTTINAAASVLTVTFLTYFLLASGRLFRAKIQRMVGTDRREGVMAALGQIETHMSRYLILTTVISSVVGAATWGLLAAVGLPNAMLLGAVALVLNFIPYVGALVTLVLILVASLVSFDDPQRILLAGGGVVAINLLEGNLVTPLVLGHKLPVNVVAIFVGLLFWGWVWGIPGAIMAVPLTVMIQVICANVDRWHRVAILLDN
ncbi:MAG: AI-2E family transporter [Gemmatimonadales bacterium]